MSGLLASLVLIGVTIGVMIILGALTWLAIFALYRVRFGRQPGTAAGIAVRGGYPSR